jgi:hypothetical protein
MPPTFVHKLFIASIYQSGRKDNIKELPRGIMNKAQEAGFLERTE